jgi:uncharacterized protein YndB with AHSA1/START domain
MTERKSLKKTVRARLEKTGEIYTAARRHVVEPDQVDRISEDAVHERTGRTRTEWFEVLDAAGAAGLTHAEIARILSERHGVPGWWAQMVTVGYERARGLRAPGERRGGGFDVSVSRTIAAPVATVQAAFTDRAARWLDDGELRLRTSLPGKSSRFDWGDGTTRVNAYFTAKGDAKTTVAVSHERLADAEAAERAKAGWRTRLTRLKELLEREA